MKVEIDENKTGGEIYSYHLMIERLVNRYGLAIANANEMRQIAKALLDKANEIEPLPASICKDCGKSLIIDERTVLTINDLIPQSDKESIILYCDCCKLFYNGLGELI